MDENHNARIADFVARYRGLQLHQTLFEGLMEELIVYAGSTESDLRNEKELLLKKIQKLEDDKREEMTKKLDAQLRFHQSDMNLQRVIQELIDIKNSNPYVVMLIDGDGLLFKESFTSQGREGGWKAANELRAAILSQCNEHARSTEVVATIFANQAGLAKALHHDGAIDHENDLRDFAAGFMQGKAMFNFRDVGYGKEKEIKDAIKWHLRNINCKQVILGVSHDAGFAPYLMELFKDDETGHRFSIVEGVPTTPELAQTGVRILDFNKTVFRKDKLGERRSERKPSNPTPTNTSVSPGVIGSGIVGNGVVDNGIADNWLSASKSGSSNRIATPSTSANSTPALAPSVPVPSAPAPSAPAASAPAPLAPVPAVTYAGAMRNATPPPRVTLPIQPRPPTTTRPSQQIVAAQQAAAAKAAPVSWNPGRRGLDPPLQVSQTVVDQIKKRQGPNKLCNNHYLRGPCAKGDSCCFEHKYKPTKDELTAIAFLTRLNPCEMRQECDIDDCIYGHHCPSVVNGQCTHPHCKFRKEDHPPGTKFKTRIVLS